MIPRREQAQQLACRPVNSKVISAMLLAIQFVGFAPMIGAKATKDLPKVWRPMQLFICFCPYSSGVAHSTYVGDDSATEIHLKTLASYDIAKQSDINHASQAQYPAQGMVKGQTPNITYIPR